MKRTDSRSTTHSRRRYAFGLFRTGTIAAAAVAGYGMSWLLGTPDERAAAAPPPGPVAAKPEAEPQVKPESVEKPSATPAKDAPASSVTGKNDKPKSITFDTIKFDMEKTDPYDRELIGPKIEALVGKKIRIRGYVHPSSSFTQTMRNFILVRDSKECCFGPGAALFDCIIVKMKPGTTAQYTTSPITVEGSFRIEELPDPFDSEANPQAIYQMEAEAAQ